MFVALSEFEVKPGCQERFENVYGPDGDWARLFRRDPQYKETRLVRDAFRPATYLTLDFWNSVHAYEEFLAMHEPEYKKLDALCEGLTTKERRVGWFEAKEQAS
jgi:heme-degrading monooxygenase HmoA